MLIMIINFLLIIYFRAVKGIGAEGNLVPVLNNPRKYLDLGLGRRRPSDECLDAFEDREFWCLLDAESSCEIRDGHWTKWTVQVYHNTEHVCYPSSCSASDLESLYDAELIFFNSSIRYCFLECPTIPVDILGTSDDGQTLSINGTLNFAKLSSDCAEAYANRISMCGTTGTCPSDAIGVTTCTYSYALLPSYFVQTAAFTNISDDKIEVCLPDECIDEANLEKLVEFDYVSMGYTADDDEMREKLQIYYSCNSSSGTKEWLIYGLISGTVVVLCMLGICIFRKCQFGGVLMTQSNVELKSLETFEQLHSTTFSPSSSEKVETGISENISPKDYTMDMRPIEIKQGTRSDEFNQS